MNWKTESKRLFLIVLTLTMLFGIGAFCANAADGRERATADYVRGGELTLTADTFYLAIVDDDAGYAPQVALALNLSADQYKVVTWDQLTAADLARADFITIDYNGGGAIDFALEQTLSYASEYVDGALRASLNAYIAGTLQGKLNPQYITDIQNAMNKALDSALEEYLGNENTGELDWAALVGAENLSWVEKARMAIVAALDEAGVSETYAVTVDVANLLWTNADSFGLNDLLANVPQGLIKKLLSDYILEIPAKEIAVLVAEAALYEIVSCNIGYSKTITDIMNANPKAVVAALGDYSHFDFDYESAFEGATGALEDVLVQFGFDSDAVLGELQDAIHKLSGVDIRDANGPIVKLLESASREYKEAANYLASLNLPAGDASSALIARLIEASNTCVGGFFGTVEESNGYTVRIPVADLLAVGEQGNLVNELIGAAQNVAIVFRGETIVVNNALDALSNLSAVHPFAHAVAIHNIFYVDITDVEDGGAGYIAARILGALTVSCDHVYDDNCEDANCNICNSVREVTDHSFTDYKPNGDAACGVDGTKTAKCDHCQKTDTITDQGSALEHSFTNYKPNGDAACGVDGTKTAKCDRCDARDTLPDEGSALEHSFTNYKPNGDATCVADGTKTAKCDRCDERNTLPDVGSILEHSFTQYTSNGDATCGVNGTKTAKCDGCDEKKTIMDVGSALRHNYIAVSVIPGTCQTFDQIVSECMYCSSTKTDPGDLGDHSPGADATCTEDQTCIYCGTILASATDHTEVVDPAFAPTCTQDGKTEGQHCSVCNTVLLAQETIPAKGHTEVVDAAKDATCTETGLAEGKHCSVCNAVLLAQETIPAKGHTEVVDASKDATCTETGLTEGKHCSVCNAVTVAQETIPAKGHTEVVDAAKDATCTETGLTEGKHCSVCNAVLLAQETVAAKGHRWVDATCTAPKTCETCGETEGEPMPHAYGEWETVTEATKKAEGKREQVCADCGHTTEETIPMLEGASAGAVVGISLGSVAVLGGLFLAFVFLKKKKLF